MGNTKLRSLAQDNNALSEMLNSHDNIYIYLKNGAWTKDIKIQISDTCTSSSKTTKKITVHRSSGWGSTIHIGTTTSNILKGANIYTFEF